MKIVDFFRKKKNMKQSPSASAEKTNSIAVTKAAPMYSIMRGTFSNSYADYETIREIISKLEKLGFNQAGIKTSGEDSGHDWTAAYRKSYASFDDFSEHARKDYQEACAKQEAGSPHLDWDSTRFMLINQWPVYLFAHNDRTGIIYKTGWAIHVPENIAADDEFLQATLNVLKKYE